MPTRFLIALVFAAGCFGQSDLRQRLSLTDGQVAAIVKLNQDYNDVWFAQQNRVDIINRELINILAAPVPDAREIGVRAVELEIIRRDRVAKQTVLRSQVVAQLSPVQVSATQQLTALFTLQPLVNDASCAYLVNGYSYSPRWLDVKLYGDATFASYPPPLPYIPAAPTASFCNSNIFPVSVRDYLSLTDVQIASIYAVSAAYNDFSARKQNRLADLQFEIQDLTATRGVDAVVLGLRYAEMAQIGRDLDGKKSQLKDSARTVLTAAQSSKLKLLQDAQALTDSNAISYAIGCNIIQLPEGSGGGVVNAGQSSFCVL